MKNLSLTVLIIILFSSCAGDYKLVTGKNTIFKYSDNQATRQDRDVSNDEDDLLNEYLSTKPFKAKITLKQVGELEYYVITPKSPFSTLIRDGTLASYLPMSISSPAATNRGYKGDIYFPETQINTLTQKSKFRYWDTKFGLQGLTVPLKVRPALTNDSLYPSQVETGVNIAFAPTVKFNYNVFNPFDKFLGKHLTSYSLSAGPLFGFSSIALSKTKNAPNLATADRTALSLSYGLYVVLGINNINVGYAIGYDRVLGSGRSEWAYRGIPWHGVIVTLDVIKF